MAEDIAIIEPGHGDLRHNHLKEGREGREYAEFVGVEAESSCSREISAFHDTRWHENLRVPLVDNLKTR